VADKKSQLNDKYGELCEITMFGYRCVIISKPEYLKELFSPNVYSPFLRRLPVSEGFKAVGMDCEGLLLNHDVDKWRVNRKTFQHSLSPPSFIKLSVKYTAEACAELTKYWGTLKHDRMVRLDEWYRAFTSDMMGLVASGAKEDSMRIYYEKLHGLKGQGKQTKSLSRGEQYRLLRTEYPDALAFFIFVPKILWSLPIIRNQVQRYRNVLDNLTSFEVDFINKRKESLQKTDQKDNEKESVRDDFLTMLLTQNGETDSSANIIKQNIREMFSAGTGTTTSALCAVAYLLAKNPECEERMVNELFSVLGKDRNIELADLSKLTYTEMVINETMRLYPVVPLTYRYSPKTELKIAEYVFPANTIFTINLAHMHRNPRYFPNPNAFDPERFAGNWKERYPQYAFSPFGQGVKACPGRNFAMAEMKTILAQVYRKYTFKLVKPDEPLHFKFSLVNDISKLEAYLEERKV